MRFLPNQKYSAPIGAAQSANLNTIIAMTAEANIPQPETTCAIIY